MIYLDNSATTFPKPPGVIAAMGEFLTTTAASPGRAAHRHSMDAGRAVFEAREKIAQLTGIADASRVIFTANATEALNLALLGTLSAGDRVVTTTLEHNSVMRPLRELARTRGIDVVTYCCDGRGGADLKTLEQHLIGGAAMVITVHGSNVTGSIQPIAQIGALAHRYGALFLVDAAQSAGVCEIDVERDGIDLLAFSGHKGLYGPPGTGVLYIRPGLDITPLRFGGTGSNSESDEQPRHYPDRHESGTINSVGIAGLSAGVSFVMEQGIRAIFDHGLKLRNRMIAGLSTVPSVRVYGPAAGAPALSTVSLTVSGMDNGVIARRLNDDFGICVRSGLHCAPGAHKTIGTFPAGSIRFSAGWFTTESDIDQALEAMREIAGSGR